MATAPGAAGRFDTGGILFPSTGLGSYESVLGLKITLIVYHVSPGNSASIKQSPVNRHIQHQLSVMFKHRKVCVWSRYQASILGWWHLLCQTRVQSLNYGKAKGRKTEKVDKDSYFGSLSAV